MNSPEAYLQAAKLPTPQQLGKALRVDDPDSDEYLTIFAGGGLVNERNRWATSASLAKLRSYRLRVLSG